MKRVRIQDRVVNKGQLTGGKVTSVLMHEIWAVIGENEKQRGKRFGK